MYSKKDRDMGCLGWFILGFLIFALFLVVLVLAFAPSGGDARPCKSPPNLTSGTVGSSTLLNVSSVVKPGVPHLPGRVGGSSGGKGGGSKPSAPKPNLNKPTTPKLKSPHKGSVSSSGGVHLDVDTEDCD